MKSLFKTCIVLCFILSPQTSFSFEIIFEPDHPFFLQDYSDFDLLDDENEEDSLFKILPDFQGSNPRFPSTTTNDGKRIKKKPIIITGHRSHQRGAECEPLILENQFEKITSDKLKLSPKEVLLNYYEITKSFFTQCEKKLSANRYLNNIIPLLESRRTHYPLLENKNIIPVRIRLNGGMQGTEIRALLGLQDLTSKRPLVILRNGLQSNRNSELASLYIMKLMDEGPYNVLALPSNTGKDFQETNMLFALGGVDEAIQTITISKELQNPELWISELISSVHVIGYSLGGQTALYTALINGHMPPLTNGKNIVDSTLAVCPVVDLNKSLNSLYQRKNIIGIFFFFSMIKQITELILQFPDLIFIGLDPMQDKLSMSKLKEAISKTVYPYYKKKFEKENWLLPPLTHLRLESEEDYWSAHNFNNFIKDLNSPVMMITSLDDSVVRTKQNSRALMKNYNRYASEKDLKKNEFNLRLLELKSGSHCQLHSGYGWGIASTLIKSWVLQNSPELHSKIKKELIKIPNNLIPNFNFERGIPRQFLGSEWHISPNKENAKLKFYFSEHDRVKKQVKKFTLNFYIPLSLINLQNKTLPKNKLDAQIMTRWLNANVQLLLEKEGVLFKGENSTRPKYFQVTYLKESAQ